MLVKVERQLIHNFDKLIILLFQYNQLLLEYSVRVEINMPCHTLQKVNILRVNLFLYNLLMCHNLQLDSWDESIYNRN